MREGDLAGRNRTTSHQTNAPKVESLGLWALRAPDLENQYASYGASHGPTQGFKFASNESKLVARNLDLGGHLKCPLVITRAILDAGPMYKVQ